MKNYLRLSDPETIEFGTGMAYRFGNLYILHENDEFKAGLDLKEKKEQNWEHGTTYGYKYCRCDRCKKAESDRSKEYRKTHPDTRNKKWHGLRKS